jgi:hypothetical protein
VGRVALLILAFASFQIVRRLLPNATFYAVMKVSAKVVAVLLLVTLLLNGLGTLNTHSAVGMVCWLCLFPAVAVSRSYPQAAGVTQYSFPAFATLAWRGPPIS